MFTCSVEVGNDNESVLGAHAEGVKNFWVFKSAEVQRLVDVYTPPILCFYITWLVLITHSVKTAENCDLRLNFETYGTVSRNFQK